MLIQTHRPTSVSSNDRCPIPLLAGGQGSFPPFPPQTGVLFFDPDSNHQGNDEPSPSSLPVDPDIPTNLDQLTDEELTNYIRTQLAYASRLSHQFGKGV